MHLKFGFFMFKNPHGSLIFLVLIEIKFCNSYRSYVANNVSSLLSQNGNDWKKMEIVFSPTPLEKFRF